MPNVQCAAIEINHEAGNALKEFLPEKNIYEGSILEYQGGLLEDQFDFVLVKGVLRHIDLEHLDEVYDKLYKTSRKYICIAEYYNPTPVEVMYRGLKSKLFKRDFAGELLDRHSDLELVDYGFSYHHDNNFPQDDLTWFLLEKR